jgi:hypothetical protein
MQMVLETMSGLSPAFLRVAAPASNVASINGCLEGNE